MITVIALTQFALLVLGTICLEGMVNANGDVSLSPYFDFLNNNWLWLFLLPIVWIAFAQISFQLNTGFFKPIVAQVTGVCLSAVCFVFFASVALFPMR